MSVDFTKGVVTKHYREFTVTLPRSCHEYVYNMHRSPHTVISAFLKNLVAQVPDCQYMRSDIVSIALRESYSRTDTSYRFEAMIEMRGTTIEDTTMGRLAIKIEFN